MRELQHSYQPTVEHEKLDVLLPDYVRANVGCRATGALAATLSRIDDAFNTEVKFRARIRR